MSWNEAKKKQALEKAMNQARQRLVPLWHRSKPLLWMDRMTLRILEPEFEQSTWCIVAYDPMLSASQEPSRKLEEFMSRYEDLDLSFALIAPAPIGATEMPLGLRDWMSHAHYRRVLVADPGSELVRGLGIPSVPFSLSVFKAGASVLQWTGDIPLSKFELTFQQWLRQEDPGLPLLDPKVGDLWPIS